MSEEKEQEFQVTDRRRLTSEGDLRRDAEAARPEPAAAPPAGSLGRDAKPAAAPPPPPPPPPAAATSQPPVPKPSEAAQQAERRFRAAALGVDKITFDRIILSYAQTAMLQLGLLAADPSQPLEPDLYGARETIDALSVLEEKTRGNLSPEEHRLLENTLYELRMAWMEINQRLAKRK